MDKKSARMTCGQFRANVVFFRIGVLAYNLFRMFELKVLPEHRHRHPKSGDGALPVGFPGRMGGIGPLSGSTGARQ